MIVIREIFTAKPGQASKFAKLSKKAFGAEPTVRVMTDVVGNYNTVVIERTLKNLVEFDREMEDMRSGKPDARMDPKVAEELSHYTEMYQTGRREIFRIVD